MASTGVSPSHTIEMDDRVSAWKSRRARRHVTASKLEQMTILVKTLDSRILDLENGCGLSLPPAEPDVEQSPVLKTYSRSQLLQLKPEMPALPMFMDEPKVVFTGEVLGKLNELNAELGEKLHQGLIRCDGPNDLEVYHDPTSDMEFLDVDHASDIQPFDFMQLEASISRLEFLSGYLSDAALVACRIDSSARSANLPLEHRAREFLEECYWFLDPQGIAERLEEEDLLERCEADSAGDQDDGSEDERPQAARIYDSTSAS